MWVFIAITVALVIGLSIASVWSRRKEISENWSKYHADPLYMFSAFLFKPDDDPRSRFKFAADNFVNVINDVLMRTFQVFLQPVFGIFKLFSDSLTQSLSGLFNIRSLLGNMWNRFNSMTDIFQRRFNGTIHQLRMTFTKLFSAMEKTFGVAVSSVYGGLSVIYTMTSFMDFMIKLSITILAILMVMMVWFFYVLWPLIPLIAIATAFVAEAGYATGTFCFRGETLLRTRSGATRRIDEVRLGTVLEGDGIVTGVFEFDTPAYDLYVIDGIAVSGTHIVYRPDGTPVHVENHPGASRFEGDAGKVYCLLTTNHRIPVQGDSGVTQFADWEELEEMDDLKRWNNQVFETLNPGVPYRRSTPKALLSEAVLTRESRIETPEGVLPIELIRPGSFVLDAEGLPTRVTGVVVVAPSEVEGVVPVGHGAQVSVGAWLHVDGIWQQPVAPRAVTALREPLYSLFTEAGTFRIAGGVAMRDFTDVGATDLPTTYDWVLESLGKNISPP